MCPVLSWEGEASAISRDAIDDTRDARTDMVIDEWDEDFDSGKVRGHPQTHKPVESCFHIVIVSTEDIMLKGYFSCILFLTYLGFCFKFLSRIFSNILNLLAFH